MDEKVPEIEIERKESNVLGLGVMKISRLKDHKPQNDHDPYKSHRLKFNLIIVVQKGPKGIHNVDFETYTYGKNSVFFIARDQVHHFVDLPKNNDGYLIVFDETAFLELSVGLPMVTNHFYGHSIYGPHVRLSQKVMHEIEGLIDDLERETKKRYSAVQQTITRTYIKLILLKIVQERTHLLKEKHVNPQSLSIFMDFQNLTKEHFATEKTTSFYARSLHISVQKLNAITQETIQLTAKQYIVKILILEAKRFLKGTDLSVKEISYRLGFDEPTNFNKFFRRYAKMSPLEFANRPV